MQSPEARLQPAREVPAFELVELTARLRRILTERGEPLAPGWPEIAAERLRTGELDGWVVVEGGRRVGLALLSRRDSRAYGHLHVEPSPDPVQVGRLLAARSTEGLPPEIQRTDFGVTGLSEAQERELGGLLRRRPGFELIERIGLSHSLTLSEIPVPRELPTGIEFLPVDAVPVGSLDELDRRAFRGGPDESLVADSPEGNRRVLERILAGELGRFLPEASMTVAEGENLVGFLLTTEENPRSASFADLAVDPAYRRRGVGAALLTRGLRALLALGYSSARLWVTAANTPARELYHALGFERERSAFIYRYRPSR
ncbi:MAG: GNAT family N-acetyltransferase [Thermoplasmata archaeon]|nr:GNAT family N-acetyltransferase [Thermoplasmata archaeon]